MITGTIYLMAMRLASIAIQKQSPGEEGASTGTGASELRPYRAWRRSACSVLVGRPVDGPPRWISQITSGNSTATARPIASVFRAMPGPDGRRDGGDFVFGLKRHYAEILVHGEFVKNVGSRRDGIRAEEQRDSGLLRRGDKSEGERGIAADIAIDARRQLGWRNFVADLKRFGGFAETVAGLHRELIGGNQLRLVLEFIVEIAEGRLHGAVVEPVAHSESEEILAAVHALRVQADIFQRGAGELGELNGKKTIAIEGMIFERADGNLRLAQIAFSEVIGIDDEDAVGFQVRQVHFERGGIHGDQDVHAVSGSVHIARGEMDLEAADTGQSAGGGANLGRVVGKRGQVVAVQGDRIGELAASDLHAITRVTAEADDRFVYGFSFATQDFRDSCRQS